MRKQLPVVGLILLLWITSCDHDESGNSQIKPQNKITLTDLDHEPAAKELLSKLQHSASNGRVSTIEVTDAFFKYEDLDSGILNYTFKLPDDAPEYFENLVLSRYNDGFYGFIYRYIPDEDDMDNEAFKGILQQYNLEGGLIRALHIPLEEDSVYAGGRTQLINQCVRSVEQTCVTTYEVETVTDYPCHCQYDRRTQVSKICTFSFNIGWCDDMIAIPPAGGGGTYVGPSGASPRTGSTGGNTSAPKPVKNPVVVVPEPGFDDITFNNVKSPCLLGVIKNLTRKDFKNKINRLAINKFMGPAKAVNLDFNEVDNIKNEKGNQSHAETSPTFTVASDGNTHVIVNLNSSTLPGTSELFQIVTIYHEALHGIFKVHNGGAYITRSDSLIYKKYRDMNEKEQHEVLSSIDVISSIVNALSDIYGRPLQSTEEREIAAIVLYGISDAQLTPNYKESSTKWKLSFDSISQIGERHERTVYDSNNRLLSIGGKQCNND